jgi:peptide/nickel transport system permease protein
MTRYIGLRLLRAAATLWLVVTLVFFGMRLAGDPVEIMLGDTATPADIARLQEAYGLDRPFVVQYTSYLGTVFRGDLGDSLAERRPVTDILAERLPATLELTGWALLVALAIGVPAGVYAAVRRGSMVDRLVIGISFIGQAVPGFFIAIIMISIFAVQLGWLPSSGYETPKHFLLPVAALAWGSLASVARITRVAVLEVMSADYVRTARAKGLGEIRVLTTHVMRNALIPIMTMVGFLLAGTVAGAIVVEGVFAWPGMGRVLQTAVQRRDFPMIQAVVMLICGAVVIVNLVIDILYGVIDPRISRS